MKPNDLKPAAAIRGVFPALRRARVWGRLLVGALLPLGGGAAQAQWLTQTNVVKPGWSAIYLHVDASHTDLDSLVGADPNNPISEVWLWMPAPVTMQFVTSPQNPVAPSSQWATWKRLGLGGGDNSLAALAPNAAYLIHSTAPTNYTWRVQGRPVPPNYSWASAGLNFIDFPTPAANPPKFDTFLSLAPGLQSSVEIYQYQGGDLGPANPSQMFTFHTTAAVRGQACWIRGPQHNDYYGPFALVMQATRGADFGDALSQYAIYLRNTTASNVNVSVRLLPSEAPPAGQTPILGSPPLLVRGNLNSTNLTYGYSNLIPGGVQTWKLAPQGQPGSDLTVVIGLNRYQMAGVPGSLYAGLLRFSDGFGLSEIDVPVSGRTASTAGLWVGQASVTQVGNYLKTYQLDGNQAPVVDQNGAYIVTSVNTNLGSVSAPYPLRLIVHNDGTNAVLLQRVYYGLSRYSNYVLATQESLLDPAHLDSARRLSATHLPWTKANQAYGLTGKLAQGGTLTATADTPYDDQVSNPFLHTYHPDHDNLNPTFSTQLAPGYEAYGLSRKIKLSINPPGSDFAALTGAGQSLSGVYEETITLSGLAGTPRNFTVNGLFSLKRLSTIPTLSSK